MSWVKPAIILVGLMLIVWVSTEVSAFIYNKGYTDAVQTQQAAAIEQQNKAIKVARAEWEATVKAAAAELVIEENITEEIRVVEKEIPIIVEKIVEVSPNCADLGPDFLWVFNSAISASNHRESGEAIAPP